MARPPLRNSGHLYALLNDAPRIPILAKAGKFRMPQMVARPFQIFKRVIAPWLAGKSMKTKDAARLDLDSLGTVGRVSG